VVVTGSSSGIGQCIAEKFAIHGDSLIVHGFTNLDGLAVSAHKVASTGADMHSIVADIREQESAMRLVQEAFARRNRVDVWINAAGADVLTGSAKDWSFEHKLEQLWKTDVAGTIRISRAVANRMLEQTPADSLPAILNISWDQAEQGMEGDSGQLFSPIKAAITAFSKSLAKSVGPRVRVNCIAPGWIQTEWGMTASETWDRRARSESMLDRWGTPQDVANVAWMLASPECEFINGQTIAVNGGWKPMVT